MTHRCSICDRTDNRSVTHFKDQFFAGPYLKDKRNPELEICQDCVDAINEILYEDEDDSEYSVE